ncbi:MAG: caspase family protein [Rhodomicrobium sp.]
MRIIFLACVFLLGSIAPGLAAPDKRVALVIGQNGYANFQSLENPFWDARGMGELLAANGFEVISCDGKIPGCFDLDREGLLAALSKLETRAAGAGLALVYYAGHGAATEEGNMLAPTDADVNCQTGAIAQGVPVERLIQATRPARHKFLILDACRDNPLRKICPGLAGKKLSFTRIEAGAMQGLLLVTSTQFGQQALDGLPALGAHSPFATALLAALKANPNVYFEQLMNEVARATFDEAQKIEPGYLQIPGKVVGGAAPADCLAGKDCIGDARMAALAAENGRLLTEAAGTRNILAKEEADRGKPYTFEERKVRVAALEATLASIGKSTDPLKQEARRLINEGDVAGGEAKLDEAGDAEEKEAAELERMQAEKLKAAARTFRERAVLARGRDVAKAVSYLRRATHDDPDDAQTWEDLAEAAVEAGRSDEAKAAFEQASLKASGEGADEIRFWAANGSGDIALAQGSLPEALRLYRSAQEKIAQLSVRSPDNSGWQRDLSVSYNKVGDVLVAQGNLPEALKSFQGSLNIRDRLAKADPNNAGWQRDLSVSYEKVGDVLVAQGNLPEALKSFQGSLNIRDRLAKADPNNAGWQRDLAVSNERLGDMFAKEGKVSDAIAAFERALSIYETLTTRLGDPQARVNSVVPLWRLGGMKGKAGQAELRRALGILVELRDAGRLDAERVTWIPEIEGQIAALETSPYQQAKAAVEAAFEAKDFDKAVALQAKLAAAMEKAEREKAGKPGPDTAAALLDLSWYRLFDRDFRGALAASDRAIAIEPERIVYATNKAHALMFLGRGRAARALYLRHKGQRLGKDGKLWEAAILDDFKEFEKRGLKNRQMGEIEALLAGK